MPPSFPGGLCLSHSAPLETEAPRSQGDRRQGKRKKEQGCRDAGLPSPATQHRPRGPALPQLLSPEVPNKPWEGQRRAGGGGEREVTELENFG